MVFRITSRISVGAAFAAYLAASVAAAGGPGPVSPSEVTLYVTGEPCAQHDDIAEIAVARAEMALADVLLSLRLAAAQRGANAVTDIRVRPGGDGRFRITGRAIRCMIEEPKAPPAPKPGRVPTIKG